MEWIHVDDSLPEPDEPVLVWNPEMGVRMGHRLGSGRPLLRPDGSMGYEEQTKFWMPLPPPPTDGG